jgi:thiol-disulfide isomerase/thioredoxin
MSARTAKSQIFSRMLKGVAFAAVFASAALAAASGPAPGFQLTGRGGKTIDLAQFKGQVVMINFWATWCGPCRKEMPLLEGIYKQYKNKGFTLIGVNVEPDPKEAAAWLGKLSKPVTFPVAFDVDSKVSKLYKVETMPSTVIVDRKGNVRALHRGYKAGDENFYLTQIRTMLKE